MRTIAKGFVRHPIRCACYLIAGALLSGVIAWTASALGPDRVLTTADMGAIERDGLHLLVQSSRGAHWAIVRFVAYPDEAQARMTASHQGREEIATRTPPAWALSSLHSNADRVRPALVGIGPRLSITAMGWPFLCLKGSQAWPGPAGPFSDEGVLHVGPRITLCYLPIWPGLLLNSIVFGATLYAVHRTCRACIRRFRSVRGRCPRCGYDRRGLAPEACCPECGPVPTQNALGPSPSGL